MDPSCVPWVTSSGPACFPRDSMLVPPLILPTYTQPIEVNYELEEIIGYGTFGLVRRCVQRKTGRKCAVKIVKKVKLLTADDVEGLRREVDILQRLKGHPRVVELWDVYEDHFTVYLVMELCEGGDLLDHLNGPGGGFTEHEAALIFYQIAEAVANCTKRGILHRDVKPENVFLVDYRPNFGWLYANEEVEDGLAGKRWSGESQMERKGDTGDELCDNLQPREGGEATEKRLRKGADSRSKLQKTRCGIDAISAEIVRVKLGDFGLAIHTSPGQLLEGMAGSDPYVCPEMIMDELYGVEADVWSMGVLLYALLSRRLPFAVSPREEGDGPSCSAGNQKQAELFKAICKGRVDLRTGPWANISDDAKDLVKQLLCVDRSNRPDADTVLRHSWLATARSVLRPDLAHTLTRGPRLAPLATIKTADMCGATGLALIAAECRGWDIIEEHVSESREHRSSLGRTSIRKRSGRYSFELGRNSHGQFSASVANQSNARRSLDSAMVGERLRAKIALNLSYQDSLVDSDFIADNSAPYRVSGSPPCSPGSPGRSSVFHSTGPAIVSPDPPLLSSLPRPVPCSSVKSCAATETCTQPFSCWRQQELLITGRLVKAD